jgi:transcriptional regulator with XRE-family HTH domain
MSKAKRVIRGLLNEIAEMDETVEGQSQDLRMDLSGAIYEYLTANNLSQQKFADMVGVKSPFLTRILHDRQNFTIDVAAKIFFAMGLRAKISVSPRGEAKSVTGSTGIRPTVFIQDSTNGETQARIVEG